MRVEELPDPRPGPIQVVVNVKAAGVNPVDTYIRAGTYARKPELPYTPGMDAAGAIESVGEGVKRFAVGDRVYTAGTLSGAYAERCLCSEQQVYRLPQRVGFEQGAGVSLPYVTAYRALFDIAHAKPAETVLIHGASGGVGIAALQLACSAGMRVIGTAGSDRGRSLITENGAHSTLDHGSMGHLDQVMTLTDGHGVDILIEMLANVNLGKDLEVLAKGGRVVVIGSRGPAEIDPRDLMIRDAAVFGMLVFNAPESQLAAIHAALFAGLDNGSLHPAVGQVLPLSDAPQAHEAVMEKGAYGKVVLVP